MTEKSDSKNSINVVIVDDDATVRRVLRHHLEHGQHQILEAGTADEASRLVNESTDVLLLDIQMPGSSGIEYLKRVRQDFPDLQVIMVSGITEVEVVVEAMKLGAFWYLSKSPKRQELLSLVAKAGTHANLSRDNRLLRQMIHSARLPVSFVGEGAESLALRQKVEKIAQLDSTVLITGESGTGKSLLARLIHESGPRSIGPFVLVSCAALPRDLLEAELFGHERGAFTGAVNKRLGRIEMAEGGTLFLDEIGDMPLELQPKLLVFLQERLVQRIGSNQSKELDVRVIAATNRSLPEMCEEKTFREDLYFRVNVLPIEVPPLRQRPEDTEALARQHLAHISVRRNCEDFRLTPDAIDALKQYRWPGNVRELENVLERATAFCEDFQITAADLGLILENKVPTQLAEAAEKSSNLAGHTLEEIEARAILDALTSCDGNKAAAARMLGISEKSIYNKIERLGLADQVRKAKRTAM